MAVRLRESIARSLAAAFNSREWARSPMPIGDASDPHSARGIVAQLGADASILLASSTHGNETLASQPVLGCVLGGVLDEALIAAYRLGPYGARCGDGLLAYIGVPPAFQGERLSPIGGDRFERRSGTRNAPPDGEMVGLGSLLFSRWLDLPALRRCPTLFVRTRTTIKPILHLLAKHGFDFRGRFELDFRGERQDRLVYARHGEPGQRTRESAARASELCCES
ncbi:MAG: hypothetical protein KDH15_19885 [Rhodocyclaceae bacterium]|nr:hypothetical protein [Rhodocyclaceae bacterium]